MALRILQRLAAGFLFFCIKTCTVALRKGEITKEQFEEMQVIGASLRADFCSLSVDSP